MQATNHQYFQLLLNEETKQIIARPTNSKDFKIVGHQNMWGRAALVHRVQKTFSVDESQFLRLFGEVLPDKKGLIFKAVK